MEENKEKKIPSVRDMISGWAIWIFSGLFFAYWVLGWESSQRVIVNAWGTKIYGHLLATTLMGAIASSAFGGPRVFKLMIEVQRIIKSIKFTEEDPGDINTG